MNRKFQKGYTLIELIIMCMIPVALACFAGWVTHVIVCIQDELWLFLVAGAIFFPVGIIHGIGVWFGAF